MNISIPIPYAKNYSQIGLFSLTKSGSFCNSSIIFTVPKIHFQKKKGRKNDPAEFNTH